MKRSFPAVALAALLGSYTQANALTVLGTQTVSFSNQQTDLYGSPALALNLYSGTNPGQTAGTLQEVTIRVTGGLSSSGTVINTAAQALSFKVTLSPFQFDLNATSSDPSALKNLVNPNTGGTFSPMSDSNVSVIGTQQYTSLASNTSASFGGFSVTGVATLADFTLAADVLGFNGSGTFVLEPFVEIATAILGGGGNVGTDIVTQASASVTVTYLGTANAVVPAPEPASALLLGVGLLGTGLIRHRGRGLGRAV